VSPAGRTAAEKRYRIFLRPVDVKPQHLRVEEFEFQSGVFFTVFVRSVQIINALPTQRPIY
jgi:hypothetical protein